MENVNSIEYKKKHWRIADIKYDDCTNGPGICVSLWTQGCPHHCKGCHNPETWSYETGTKCNVEELKRILIDAIKKDGITRNFSILGGEPLDDTNIYYVKEILDVIRNEFPDIVISLWTGYTIEELFKNYDDEYIVKVLKNLDYLIDGRFEIENKDITLKWRGSTNQRIFKVGKTEDIN